MTLLVGTVVVIGLGVAAVVGVRVPYVALTPGPTWDTLGTDQNKALIQVTGGDNKTIEGKPTAGQLRLVTVGLEDQLTLVDALRGWLSGADAVVPREVEFPPKVSKQQVDQENQAQFKSSQEAAIMAALRLLGYPVKVVITGITDGLPAQGHLQVNDQIATVDGQPVTSAQRLTALIRGKPAGTGLAIGYVRAGVAGTTTLTTVAAKGQPPRIGVEIREDQPSPYHVSINLNNVGGPSAGLMFTLGIIDRIKGEDLTGGKTIAGTGTIDEDGIVGPIGGIPQKMRGARRDHATVFLTPADNCAEAVANAVPGLELVKVTDLNSALQDLDMLRSGGTPPLCAGK
jgi:PDZ domain-containing protein